MQLVRVESAVDLLTALVGTDHTLCRENRLSTLASRQTAPVVATMIL